MTCIHPTSVHVAYIGLTRLFVRRLNTVTGQTNLSRPVIHQYRTSLPHLQQTVHADVRALSNSLGAEQTAPTISSVAACDFEGTNVS